jgi:hypothetical protein
MKFDNFISFDSRGLAAEEYQRLSGEPVRRDAKNFKRNFWIKICKNPWRFHVLLTYFDIKIGIK